VDTHDAPPSRDDLQHATLCGVSPLSVRGLIGKGTHCRGLLRRDRLLAEPCLFRLTGRRLARFASARGRRRSGAASRAFCCTLGHVVLPVVVSLVSGAIFPDHRADRSPICSARTLAINSNDFKHLFEDTPCRHNSSGTR